MSILAQEWRMYLSYLNSWVADHQDPMYAGMSPAGYDEWSGLDSFNYEEDVYDEI